MRPFHRFLSLAALTLLAPGAGQAQSGYNIQAIVKAGETIAGVPIDPVLPGFDAGGLNDSGELIFYARSAAGKQVLFDDNAGRFTPIAMEGDTIGGVVLSHFQDGGDGPSADGHTVFLGRDANDNHLLLQYAAGKTSLLAAPGMAVPGGHLDSDVRVATPVSMNWQGAVVFSADMTLPDPLQPTHPLLSHRPGVFLWDAQKQQLTSVAAPGSQLGNFTVLSAIGGDPPAINNNGEMVVDVTGDFSNPFSYFQGLLFIGADGKAQPIIQFHQKLPDGSTAGLAHNPILNDAGVVAFAVRQNGGDAYYLWDKATGSIGGPIVAVGQDAWGDGNVAGIEEFDLDPITPSGWFQVRIDNLDSGPRALYQFLIIRGQSGTQGPSLASAPAWNTRPQEVRRKLLMQKSPYKAAGRRGKSRGSDKPQPGPPETLLQKSEQIEQKLEDNGCKIADLQKLLEGTEDLEMRKALRDQISSSKPRTKNLTANSLTSGA